MHDNNMDMDGGLITQRAMNHEKNDVSRLFLKKKKDNP